MLILRSSNPGPRVSAMGQNVTSGHVQPMSEITPTSDIDQRIANEMREEHRRKVLADQSYRVQA